MSDAAAPHPARRDVVSFRGDSLSAGRAGIRPPLPVLNRPESSREASAVPGDQRASGRRWSETDQLTLEGTLAYDGGSRVPSPSLPGQDSCGRTRACVSCRGLCSEASRGRHLHLLMIGLCSWPCPAQCDPGLSHNREGMVTTRALGSRARDTPVLVLSPRSCWSWAGGSVQP